MTNLARVVQQLKKQRVWATTEVQRLNAALAALNGNSYGVRAKGVDVEKPKIAPYGMKQIYVRDPDGFGICFQWKANE